TVNCAASSGAFNTSEVATANLVTATVTMSGASAGNYTLGATGTSVSSTSRTASANITPAPLTVTALNQSMVLHGLVPSLTFKIDGFVNGEGSSVLTMQPTCTTTGTSTSPVVVTGYPITCSGATAANYTFTYVNGTLTITYAAPGGACDGDASHQVLQPINTTGTMSVFKMGSTVPTKFRVCDASGASIGTPGVVTGYGLVAAANSSSISVDEDAYSTTPDLAFRWDPAGQQWIFNQSTKSNPSLNKTNTIYYFAINLNDGTSILFQYGLK
ncbi:MAG: hypothetical protein DMG27_10320, partial [Acidobacteria bacterium]